MYIYLVFSTLCCYFLVLFFFCEILGLEQYVIIKLKYIRSLEG